MIIWKSRLCSADIEALIDFWGQLIVGDLGNGGQAADEPMGQIVLGQLKKSAAEKALKEITKMCLQNWTYVGNTKGKLDVSIWNWDKKKVKNKIISNVT